MSTLQDLAKKLYEEKFMSGKKLPEEEPEKVEPDICGHQCLSNCRRVGCNCLCGEWHCDKCNGSGVIEIMGGSESDEWGVIDTKPCACRDEE